MIDVKQANSRLVGRAIPLSVGCRASYLAPLENENEGVLIGWRHCLHRRKAPWRDMLVDIKR